MNAGGGPCGPRQAWPEPTAPPDFEAGDPATFLPVPARRSAAAGTPTGVAGVCRCSCPAAGLHVRPTNRILARQVGGTRLAGQTRTGPICRPRTVSRCGCWCRAGMAWHPSSGYGGSSSPTDRSRVPSKPGRGTALAYPPAAQPRRGLHRPAVVARPTGAPQEGEHRGRVRTGVPLALAHGVASLPAQQEIVHGGGLRRPDQAAGSS
jgi:hypothetical protein